MQRREHRSTIGGNTPEGFKEALEMAKARILGNPRARRILNINCGNEWADSVYIERDTRNGMKCLEAVKSVFPSRNSTK